MPLRLKSYTTFPPGGFYYQQPGYPKKKFTDYDGFLDQARRISKFRTANQLPRATVVESAEDLEASVCGRAPGACYDTDQPWVAIMALLAPSAGCASCGS